MPSGDDQFTVPAALTVPATLNGEAGSDIFDASLATVGVTLNGGDGADQITGGTANDTIRGGAGNDAINTAATAAGGANTIVGGAGQDNITLSAAAGVDTIAFQASDLVPTAAGADVITAFAVANDLIGLGPDLASLAVTAEAIDTNASGAVDSLALSVTPASGTPQFLAVLAGVTDPTTFTAANVVNVSADVFG